MLASAVDHAFGVERTCALVAGATEFDAAEVCLLAPPCSDGAPTDGLREMAAATLSNGSSRERGGRQ